MADQSKLEQMLEKLVNNDRAGADSLFHEFVIEKSRSIYEKMLEDEAKDLEVDEATDEDVEEGTEEEVDEATDEEVDEATDEEVDEATDEEVDEASDEEVEEASDEEVEETFDEFAPEAEMDPTDDMMGDMDADDDGEEEMGDDDMEDRVVDLEDALDDLKAEFEKMMSDKDDDEGDDDAADMDMDGDDEEAEEEAFDASELSVADEMPAFEGKKSEGEQMREYVEKVMQPKGEDNKAKSPVAGKNDMGGTAGNIVAGGEGSTSGSAMSAKEDNAGNVNVPGGKASKSMSNAKAAEKSEKGADTDSVIGS